MGTVQGHLKDLEPQLSGKGAHVEALAALEGLDWRFAGASCEGTHSIFQQVNHMSFWQDWALKWLDGEKAALPSHAEASWPGEGSPSGAREWKQAVSRFKRGLSALESRARKMNLLETRGGKTRLEMLQTMAAHNSYHIGQVVLVRQMLRAWPPPSGGLTW